MCAVSKSLPANKSAIAISLLAALTMSSCRRADDQSPPAPPYGYGGYSPPGQWQPQPAPQPGSPTFPAPAPQSPPTFGGRRTRAGPSVQQRYGSAMPIRPLRGRALRRMQRRHRLQSRSGVLLDTARKRLHRRRLAGGNAGSAAILTRARSRPGAELRRGTLVSNASIERTPIARASASLPSRAPPRRSRVMIRKLKATR